jgi:tetratricopeptide (TPR) repeat protein
MRRTTAALFVFCALPLLARTEESTRNWSEDLAVFQRELPRVHKNLFHSMTREEFDAAVARLTARVPDLDDDAIVVELARIVARVGDGHTHINFADPALGFHFLPLRLTVYPDGLYVDAAAKEYAALVGKRVMRIGNLSAAEALARAMAITPGDNDSGRKAYVPLALISAELLHGLGIVETARSIVIDGVTVKPLPFKDATAIETVDASQTAPLYLNQFTPGLVRNAKKNFWYQYLPDSRVLYVQFNAVYWSDDDSPGSFFAKVFEFADHNAVDKLIIDVRQNGGGNNSLILPIIHGIIKRDALNQRGKLFAIIGRQTFSAAQNFINHLQKHTNVLFAGEPSGGSPNHFGDPRPVTLPHRGLTVNVSTLWWQDLAPTDTRAATLPDIAVDLTPDDYRSGRDPVLEALIPWKTLTERLTPALDRSLPSAEAEYKAFKNDPRHRNLDTQGETNRLAYSLLKQSRFDDALALFRWNAASYLESADPYDGMAEVLLAKGDRPGAIESYEKSLQLNPRNFWVRRRIGELKK